MSFLKGIKGVKIKINFLLLMLIGFYLYLGYGQEIIIGIGSVLCHEMIHVVTSIRLGIQMDEIELFPFGGIAKADGIFWFSITEEIIVAVVGPATNFVIALLFYLLKEVGINNSVINLIIRSNIIIGSFNLLPVFPLDGGKIVRALFSNRVGFKACTRMMTKATYFICIFVIIIGVVNFVLYQEGLYLILISIFVLLAARKENKMAAFLFIYEILKKRGELKKKRIMGTHLLVGIKTVSAKEITSYFLPKRYHIIIVIDDSGNSIGSINENDLFEGILKYGIDVTLQKLLIEKEK
ncbi:M50 family metallopeptidase [Sporosalibacterium faouarense]|uniref:M50 family metallopeptidase n=1 Tax=Sporosalibacterium faouarense TaxID=516123 RepID=UPI00141C5811|nr:M50 family metallopeptidase [Sporosalibacterium faouarense]MTI48501.1 hypothetical protein [Bacillota bacterium]